MVRDRGEDPTIKLENGEFDDPCFKSANPATMPIVSDRGPRRYLLNGQDIEQAHDVLHLIGGRVRHLIPSGIWIGLAILQEDLYCQPDVRVHDVLGR